MFTLINQFRYEVGIVHLISIVILLIYSLTPIIGQTTPQKDQAAFRKHYQERFPTLSIADFADGVYAIDPIARQTWQAIEEFPPYEDAIEQGKKLFETPFVNGKSYADCFADKGVGITNSFPRWDETRAQVITLTQAINDCRSSNKTPDLPYNHNDMLNLLAYMAYTSRGKPLRISVPQADVRALSAYEQGKAFYYRRRGQLNFACATCHVQNAGKKLRAETLSASLGHTANWPVYRLKWGEVGTLHRRFAECLTQIKAKPYAEQSAELKNLEYFLSFMGNGVPITGPSVRK
jgi:sulfur-oxidizing protein SoxA